LPWRLKHSSLNISKTREIIIKCFILYYKEDLFPQPKIGSKDRERKIFSQHSYNATSPRKLVPPWFSHTPWKTIHPRGKKTLYVHNCFLKIPSSSFNFIVAFVPMILHLASPFPTIVSHKYTIINEFNHPLLPMCWQISLTWYHQHHFFNQFMYLPNV
jgi:hypothetical protein